MHTLEIGRIGELKAITMFVENQFEVFEPVVDIYESDFIVNINNEFKKIQVKTTKNITDGKMKFDFRRTSGYKQETFTHKEYSNIDYYIVYCIENDFLGIIPFSDVGNSISIRVEKPKNNQKNFNWHENYSLKKFIDGLLAQ